MSSPPRLRSTLLLFLGLIVVVLALHVLDLGARTNTSVYLRNALHAPVFGLLALSILLILRQRVATRYAYLWAFLIGVLVGVVGEFLQVFGARLADVVDLANDIIGIVAFLSVFACFDADLRSSFSGHRRTAIAALALIAAAATLVPFAWYVYVLQARASAMPTLLAFESGWEKTMYSRPPGATPRIIPTPQDWPRSGGHVAELILDQPRVPGLKLFDPYPDWSSYENLSFVASAVGDKDVKVSLRVHDDDHDYTSKDRFGRSILIEPKPNIFRIPLEEIRLAPAKREMDLARIDALMFYITRPKGGERILIDDIRLERSSP